MQMFDNGLIRKMFETKSYWISLQKTKQTKNINIMVICVKK